MYSLSKTEAYQAEPRRAEIFSLKYSKISLRRISGKLKPEKQLNLQKFKYRTPCKVMKIYEKKNKQKQLHKLLI